jgi:hypothetical protein
MTGTGFPSIVEQRTEDERAPAQRMRLRYGFNEIYGWWNMSRGEHNAEVRRHLRLMDTRIVRIFAFDQPVPDPFYNWHGFSIYIQGVLDAGAVPMITFARFEPPFDNARNIARYVSRCREVVWSCIEQWGGDVVRDWLFCIWNEPNNKIVGGDLTYEQYRRIYLAAATGIMDLLAPHLDGRKARIGGPAIDGNHRAYWMDWIARLVDDVDDRLIGFVSWHRYGDWRPAVPSDTLGLKMWGSPDSPSGAQFEKLLMGQTPSYESMARGVARLVRGRDILNICGELNTISHHENYYTLGLNQNVFGAAFYASALIHLIRGGADAEMRWTGTAHGDDAYGLIRMDGKLMPAGLAKQIFAQHVRFGDWVRFPALKPSHPEIDALVAWHDDGRLSAVFVNTSREACSLRPIEWDSGIVGCDTVLRLDTGTGEQVAREVFDGTVRFDGYGIAIVTNAASSTILD